ncbi:MAG TPA: 5'-nucleotidase, lipoprotein e(P4) family [Bacteroidales bacterium]|nr:5'-nucleotidase, lipoprotein e(P4) family [Bacteroidales bacterium]HBZ67907.1 5'-nucleotidase, lipoprotein e(P4) family [Bacteroidales bacterium]
MNKLPIIRRVLLSAMIGMVLIPASDAQQKSGGVDNTHLLMATLWYQRADEFSALCYQAYNLAQLRLDQEMATGRSVKPRAIVVDIDETVLDNSPFEARCIVNRTNYPTGWSEWVVAANAGAIPGAVEFLNYASSLGVEVFYISNRKEKERASTIDNLMNQRFPMADSSHLLLRTTETNKEARRNHVLASHKIVMLMGDNLNDFTSAFEGNTPLERRQNADSLQHEFGRRYIVLPNPMYGDWEGALWLEESPNDSIKNVKRLNNLILK